MVTLLRKGKSNYTSCQNLGWKLQLGNECINHNFGLNYPIYSEFQSTVNLERSTHLLFIIITQRFHERWYCIDFSSSRLPSEESGRPVKWIKSYFFIIDNTYLTLICIIGNTESVEIDKKKNSHFSPCKQKPKYFLFSNKQISQKALNSNWKVM